MSVRYKPDHAGIGALLTSSEMQDVVRQVAEKGADYARTIAPIGGPRDPARGEFKASFSVDVVVNGGLKGDRAEARITNSSEHERLTDVFDGYHVLADTAEWLGAEGTL